jgi:hypothetical protein
MPLLPHFVPFSGLVGLVITHSNFVHTMCALISNVGQTAVYLQWQLLVMARSLQQIMW